MKQIGKLSASGCSQMLSLAMISSASNTILEELGTILKIKSFKDKAKVKSIKSQNSLYISIFEEKYNADIVEDESPDKDFQFSSAPSDFPLCHYLRFVHFNNLRTNMLYHQQLNRTNVPN